MLGTVHAQVSRRVKVSVSDRGFPAFTDRSGTQRARRLGHQATDPSSKWFSRASVFRGLPSGLAALSAVVDGMPSKIMPRISRV